MNTISPINNIPAFLEDYVKVIANQEKFIEYSINTTGSNVVSGYLSNMCKLNISGYKCHNGVKVPEELPLICKLLSKDDLKREIYSVDVIFKREVYFYNTIVPIFTKFLMEKNIPQESTFLSIPKCYLAVYDNINSEANQSVVILEDLKRFPNGGLQPLGTSITFDCVELVMIALSKFHALSFALRDQKPELIEQFKLLCDSFLTLMKSQHLQNNYLNIHSRVISYLESQEVMEKVTKLKETYIQLITDCCTPGVAEPFSVIGHGDCWNSNIMYLYENDKPKSLHMFDFQLCRFGSPALDISYFFMNSTTKQFRDLYLNKLIQVYYTHLANNIRILGSDPEQLFTFANLQEQLQKFSGHAVMFAPILIGMSNFAMQFEMVNKSKEELKEAGHDDYLQCINDIFSDAIEYGWI